MVLVLALSYRLLYSEQLVLLFPFVSAYTLFFAIFFSSSLLKESDLTLAEDLLRAGSSVRTWKIAAQNCRANGPITAMRREGNCPDRISAELWT
jgi:hypothetical protein